MRKYFILALVAAGMVSFSALAFIEQSASGALSLNNTVNNSNSVSVPAPSYADRNVEEKPAAAAKTLDIRNSVAKNVSLERAQELVIILPEKSGQSWKVNYDSSKISMVTSMLDGKNRKVIFSQTSSKDNTLYFDCIDENGETIQNKAVYIKVN